jgi:hypothetical protein
VDRRRCHGLTIPPTGQRASCQRPVAGPRVSTIVFIFRHGALHATRHRNIYATPRGQYEGGFSLFEENGAIPPCA